MNTDAIAIESSIMLATTEGLLINALNTGDPAEIERMVKATIAGIHEFLDSFPEGSTGIDVNLIVNAQTKGRDFARKVKYGE